MSDAKWQEVYKVQTAAITELEQRIAELQAERDRLREALQEIANKDLSGWATRTGLPPYDVQSCINIAKIALKEIDNE